MSGQQVEVVVRMKFPQGESHAHVATEARLVGGAGDVIHAASVEWTYASHEENDRQPREREVDRRVAELYAARARAEATEANRRGDFDAARRVIERTATRIRQYAGNDEHLNACWRALSRERRNTTRH
ncbi:MAG: hypothetical protein H0T48_16530 [Gemmatimonadaceae bacterium]|nr:hypothetical protein [Gemmatimonadaceae bacterium]